MRQLVTLAFVSVLLMSSWIPLQAQDEAAADCPATLTIGADAELFVSIRRFEGVDPADFPAVNHYAGTEFLPLLKESPGYIFYATTNNSEDGSGSAVNIFTSEEEMQAANELAVEHVAENLAAFLPNPPEIFSGPVQLLVYANRCPETEMAADGDSETMAADEGAEEPSLGYLGYRVYREIEDWDVDIPAANELVREQFAPIISAAEGFVLFFNFLMPGEAVVAVNLFASQAELTEANAQAAEFVAAEFSEILTGPPVFYGGSIAVLDLSGLFPEAAMEELSEETEED